MLVARGQAGAVPASKTHSRVGAGQVGVEVDHLRLEPEPEVHAELAHPVGQRLEALRPDAGVDRPVAQRAGVVAAAEEPAVVEHEALRAQAAPAFGERDQGVEVVLEVDGLPGVEHHGPGRPGPFAAGGGGSAPASSSRPSPHDPYCQRLWNDSPRPEHDLARQQHLTGRQVAGARRGQFGGEDLVAAPREVGGPHEPVPEPESALAGDQQQRVLQPRLAAPRGSHPLPHLERPPLRHPLQRPAAGQVEDLGRLRGHRQRQFQRVDPVRLRRPR